MKFIHLADIHLGKYQNSKSERYIDFFTAFEKIIDYTIEKKADFIVCAGDFFDTKMINATTLNKSVNLLSRLKEAGIPFYATEGNHDRAYYLEKDSWLCYLSDNGFINLLKPDLTPDGADISNAILETDDYRIIGLGYNGAATKKRIEEFTSSVDKANKFTVILLHAALIGQIAEDMAGVEKEQLLSLAGKGSYLALGHIHKHYSIENIYNPGSIEYVSIEEAKRGDKKGFLFIDTDSGVEFIPVLPREHLFLEEKVYKDDTTDSVFKKLSDKITDPKEPVINIELFSDNELTLKNVDTVLLTEQIEEKYQAVSVTINTHVIGSDGKAFTFADKPEIEKDVLFNMYFEKGYDEDAAKKLTEFTIGLKEGVLAEEIVDDALSLLGEI
ncbi:MAG: DNA repair exonuclease [Eubacteriales bacterium]